MSNAASTESKGRSASEVELDSSLPPALKRIKFAHTSSLKKNELKPKAHADAFASSEAKPQLNYRILAPSVLSSEGMPATELSTPEPHPVQQNLLPPAETKSQLKYRIISPSLYSPEETPTLDPSISTPDQPSPKDTIAMASREVKPQLKYRIIAPSLYYPEVAPAPALSTPEPTQPPAPTHTRTRRLTIQIPLTLKTPTPAAPPRPRQSKYTTDPLKRRAQLAQDPAIQFIEHTPYAIFCRPCQKTHDLERRGKGWHGKSWFHQHAQTLTHKGLLRAWKERGGDEVEREDEERQWRCVYWRAWCGEEGREVVRERVVRREEAEAVQGFVLGFWGEGEEVREEDMVEFVSRAGRRGKCGECTRAKK